MGEWKEVILKDVVTILGDGLHGTPQYDDNGEYYFINGNNLCDGKIVIKESTKKANNEEYEKYKKDLNDQTIFVSINGTLGNVALYNNEKCILGKSACYFNVLEEVDKYFIKYVVTNKNFQEYIHNFANGTTIKNVSLNTMREYPFLLPPLSEQQAIATILSSLDDKIDLLHRQNKTLEQLAETIFRQWFVEEADESWETKSISDIIDVRDGTHDSPKQSESGFYLITSRHMKPTGIDFSTAYKISEEDFNAVNRRSKVDKNDILFSMIGTLGLIHLVNDDPDYAIKNIGLFKASQKSWFTKYLYLLLRSPIGQKFIYESADGSTQEYITLSNLRNFEFLYPGEILIKEFNIKIEPLFTKIKLNTNQIRTLTQLRDTLLPKLMSGEVRVKL